MLCAGSADQKTGLPCAVTHVEMLRRECSFSPKEGQADALCAFQRCAGTLAPCSLGSKEEQGVPDSSAFSSSYALIQTPEPRCYVGEERA